jgi:hypothetical protein
MGLRYIYFERIDGVWVYSNFFKKLVLGFKDSNDK